jgi:hypothetical protein
MAKSTAQLLLVCLACCMGVLQTFMISPISSRTSRLLATSDASQEDTRKKSNKPIPICLIAADQVLLPGETATIWTEEERLIDDCVEHHYGVFAMGVVLVDENSDEIEQQEGNNDLLEIASLVEVKDVEEPDEDGDGIFVTVTCVGRVRLERLQQTYPYFKFRCTTVEDKIRELPKCHLVADNIEAFLKKLSRTEEDLDIQDEENHDSRTLLERYKNAYGRAMETGTSLLKDQSRAAQLLTAISWAAFTSIEDPELEHYRARALDFDDLLERLKLAQYVMREKELRLQGHAMRSESEAANDGDAAVVEDACFTEGFQ